MATRNEELYVTRIQHVPQRIRVAHWHIEGQFGRRFEPTGERLGEKNTRWQRSHTEADAARITCSHADCRTLKVVEAFEEVLALSI